MSFPVRTTQFPKIYLGLLVAVMTSTSFAKSSAEVDAQLKAFFSSDAKAAELMDAPVQKFDSKGNMIQARSAFSAEQIKNRKFVSLKNKQRDNMFKMSQDGKTKIFVRDLVGGRAIIEGNDDVSQFSDNGRQAIRSLQQMDASLRQAKLAESPWSDDYWAIYTGVTAKRFNDDNFPGSTNWKENVDYVRKNPNVAIDALSPAEKYDLLVGDKRKTYTELQLNEGAGFFSSSGSVETWMGICHGWAPAAFQMARPAGTVTATAADGVTQINFYPSDMKALASSLWATANVPSRFVGGRCDTKNPKKNAVGRITDQECFDNNPGTWHMGIVNQIGVSKRSFVMDVTYDFEVWNQPVYGYKYSYFNPQTQKTTESLEEAAINLKDFSADKFKEFRNNSRAVKVVGVVMDVQYVVETDPSAAETDSPEQDAIQSVQYMYDLELDAQGNIVGGEWYQNTHPDFMWVPAKNARARTLADRFGLSRWDASSQPLPRDLARAGQNASRTKMPLAAIVESLIEASRK